MSSTGPIGIFDSGYGGLTVMKEIVKKLPAYDYVYLGDNARAPYGNRSFDTVYRYTLECVKWFFEKGCPLVILACNTASAKALRTIQQNDLEKLNPSNRVLGVIRPTTEIIGQFTKSGSIGILATNGTVQSKSYAMEINKFYPEVNVVQEACPMWVPLVENNEYDKEGADYFIQKNIQNLLAKDGDIDTILLACTHYPLLMDKLVKYAPKNVRIVSQGEIVADSLSRYLANHPELESRCTKTGSRSFYTTDSEEDFENHATTFFGEPVKAIHAEL
ncbi:MAG: glutamate racemase [Chitinophagaceae bacterium]|nr:glutamate racemase [Chitinophagaceae bacterium]